MANIQFGTYTPPKEPKKGNDLELGIFFDGTLNNKQNTRERENNTEIYRKNGIKTWKERQISEKKDTSYDNDWSNVARMSESCINKVYPIYIEGIGSEDKKKDDSDGFGFGSGDTGIIDKVIKGCEKIVDEIKKKGKVEFNTLTLDVFGFSRGAAAARNFVYEVTKDKYPAVEVWVDTNSDGSVDEKEKRDAHGKKTDLKVLPKHGHLGLKLQESNITIERIVIRLLGIYDTVSSFHPNFSVTPNFNNDVKELHLNEINSARNVFHFVATDEHRENFDLTHTHKGEEKTFPGVHSDIGGSYLSEEEWVRELDTDWGWGGREKRLETIQQRLIAEGWYTRKQLFHIDGKSYDHIEGRRFLWKTYSFIPLKFMVEKANKVGCSQILLNKINQNYNFSKDSLLLRVEKRLRSYVFNNGKSYDFKWFHEINKKYKGKEKDPNYQKELDEQKDLRTLRNKYLHWSSDRYAIGMDPNSDWKRDTH